MKKRLDRKDMLILAAMGAVYAVGLLLYIGGGSAFGSKLDWASQHYAIPDYLRKLFFDTGEPFPSFAPHIGAGENIYVLSYYGLFSPVILLSYLLPFLSMAAYIQISSAVLCFLGGALFYRFARKENGRLASAALAAAYLCAAPIILHSHRHIMFVNYMPFLILAYEAVDSFFEGRRRWTLTLWTLMVILTSWFFSVAAIISITFYGVYRYLSRTERFALADFVKSGAAFALRIVCAVMLAGVLLLPTLHVLMQGRDDSNVSLSLKSMLPSVRLDFFGYSSYALGMGCFALLAVCGAIVGGGKAERFLGIAVAAVVCLPPINYLLNGTMYLNGKVLIPFIPAVLVLCARQLRGIGRRELIVFAAAFVLGMLLSKPSKLVRIGLIIDFFVLAVVCVYSRCKNDKRAYLVSLTLVPFAMMLITNYNDLPLPTLESMDAFVTPAHERLCGIIGQDENLWRSSIAEHHEHAANTVLTADHYSPYIYSSIHHKEYNDFYFDVMNNENEYRNSALTTRSQNPLFEMYIANKYLISEEETAPYGYDEVACDGEIRLYQSRYALPIGRLQQPLGEDVFDALNDAEKMEALCRYVITGSGGEYESTVMDMGEIPLPEAEGIIPAGESYQIVSDEEFSVSLPLPFEVQEGSLLVLELDCDNTTGKPADARLTINGIRNTLTDPGWKYYNNNTKFTYVLSPGNGGALRALDLTFTAGDFTVTKLHAYKLDLPKDAADCDALLIDKAVSKGDVIKGTINASEDGWFKLCVPYDEAFTITVDGKEQAFECVDKAFIGFEMTKGEHTVELRFTAPLLREGKFMSAAGLLLFVVLIVVELVSHRRAER